MGSNHMEEPMYPDGTRIEAECDFYSVAGPLVGNHECFDGLVTLRDEMNDGEIVTLNGWLWSIEVVPEELAVQSV
jgi:hypothetical protein